MRPYAGVSLGAHLNILRGAPLSPAREVRSLVDEYRIGRVIARPFTGDPAAGFRRMPGRKDVMIRALGNINASHMLDTKLFDFAGSRVRAGLMTPTMCLSFGGELDGLHALPGYQRLRDTCAEHNVEVFESVMSLSGMVNVGQGALVVGFAAEPAKIEV